MCLLAFEQEGVVQFICRNMPESDFVVFGPEFIDMLMCKSPALQQKCHLEKQRMLCPFNRGKMAASKDLAVQVSRVHGCLILHKMLHEGFSSWQFFPSLHPPAFAGAAGGGRCFPGLSIHAGWSRPETLL